MKDHLRTLVEGAASSSLKSLVAREYLQARILQCFQDDGVFLRWAFHGGTALRFLFYIPRYSEDLDFSVLDARGEAGFRPALRRVGSALGAEGYSLTVKLQDEKTVASAFLRFRGLPHELGFSHHPTQTLSIKIEVDTNPPAGAGLETTLVRRHVTLNLLHHDKPTLLAGKIHALLSRQWTKGRDLYDLVWYLADRSWPEPNLPYLNRALAQTGWQSPAVTSDSWRQVLDQKLIGIDWARAREDVRPFLERPRDADLIAPDTVLGLLR
jgi:hypothetical protein